MKIYYLLFIFLTISFVSAISVEDFNLALNYSNSKNFSESIEILENHCNDFRGDSYKEAQCYFVLGYCYLEEFIINQQIVKEDENGIVLMGPTKNLFFINKSIENYNYAIKLSLSNLTDQALKENKKSGFLMSSLFMNAENYVMLKDYDNAEKMLEKVNTILSIAPDSENLKKFKLYYEKIYSAIPKKVEVYLQGDLNPLFYSQPEIKPDIILESNEDSDFKEIYVEYINLNGNKFEKINKLDNKFIFDQKLILYKKYSIFFPFDTFYSEISISPARIQNKTMEISVIGESSNIKGTAIFEKNKIILIFKRKISYIIKVIVSFIILTIGLLFFNKKIKYMKKQSFQPNNLIKEWSLVVSLVSLIFFITINFSSIFNLLSLFITIFLCLTIFKIGKKYIIYRKKLGFSQ